MCVCVRVCARREYGLCCRHGVKKPPTNQSSNQAIKPWKWVGLIRHWLYISLKKVAVDIFDILIFRTRIKNGYVTSACKVADCFVENCMFLSLKRLIMESSILNIFIIVHYMCASTSIPNCFVFLLI